MRYKDKLINAVYRIDVDEVRTLVDDYQFSDIAKDISLLSSQFPLYYITLCHKEVLAETYVDSCMPRVVELRQRCDDMMRLWRKEYKRMDAEIEYNRYCNYFLCASQDSTFKEAFWCEESEVQNGEARQIDLDLALAVKKFDFETTERLLLDGANMDLIIDGESLYDMIESELNFLCSCEVQLLGHELDKNKVVTSREIGDLIGWAAYVKMYKLLSLLRE